MRVLALILSLAAGPALAADCDALPTSAGELRYCRTGGGSSVLYLFHSGGGDERLPAPAWTSSAYTVITITWGPVWFLKGDKLAAFEYEVLPQLERAKPLRRVVFGGSMGGFNAYLAWTQAPHLFDAAALVCPAFAVDPFETRLHTTDELRAFAREMRKHFRSASEWASYQPNARPRGDLPPAYVVWNRNDQFGFAVPEGLPATIEVRPGGHCEGVDTPGLREFLNRAAG